MAQEQEDGCYERLNSTLLKSGKGIGNIVCLVGALEATNGDSVDLKCADDGIVKVFVEPDFEFQQGRIVEIIGAAAADHAGNPSIQCFVTRDMGDEFDLQLYNEMITKVMRNERFKEYFT